MNEKNEKLIDIDKVLKNSKPTLYKLLPKFVLDYFIRLIHQEDVNGLIIRNGHRDDGLPFLNDVLADLKMTRTVYGFENIPSQGKYVFASNHPLGGLDGMIIISEVGAKLGNVKSIINELLLNIKNLRSIFVGVNMYGHNTREQVKAIDELYESDNQVVVFPAGLVSRKHKGGVIKDLTWKKSFLTKAIQYKRDVVPVYFGGQNSNWFYSFARFRKRLGIKLNIELVFLPKELFKQKGNNVTLHFGKPISYTVFDKRYTTDQWAELLKEHVYALGRGGEMNPLFL